MGHSSGGKDPGLVWVGQAGQQALSCDSGQGLVGPEPDGRSHAVGETQGISQGLGGGESEIGPARSPAHTGHSPWGLGAGAPGGLHRSIHTAQGGLYSASSQEAAHMGKYMTCPKCERASEGPQRHTHVPGNARTC